ncbi:CDP-glycerol glycerophosphotransferase, TagB/SpsB family [Lachnospiraceae bacterium NE2001]|nr:CDP-glycerol glycerophosphotransferase, TagB/SpsB family [Lachnospiraceae bacterium NE2001]
MSTGSIHIIYKKNREDFIREFNDYLDKGGEKYLLVISEMDTFKDERNDTEAARAFGEKLSQIMDQNPAAILATPKKLFQFPDRMAGTIFRVDAVRETGIRLQSEYYYSYEADFLLKLIKDHQFMVCQDVEYFQGDPGDGNLREFSGIYDKKWYLEDIESFLIPMLRDYFERSESSSNIPKNTNSSKASNNKIETDIQRGPVPLIVQFFAMYYISCRLNANQNNKNRHALSEDEAVLLKDLISEALQFIDDDVIMNTYEYPVYKKDFQFKRMLLRFKYKNEKLDALEYYDMSQLRCNIQLIDYHNGTLEIDGSLPDTVHRGVAEYFFEVGDRRYPVEFCERYSLTKYFGISAYKRLPFHATLPNVMSKVNNTSRNKLTFCVEYKGKKHVIPLEFKSHTSRIAAYPRNSYWHAEDLLVTAVHTKDEEENIIVPALMLRKYNFPLMAIKELGVGSELLLSFQMHRFRFFLLRAAWVITRPYFRKKNIWLFFDKIYKAGDSSEYLYKYAVKQLESSSKEKPDDIVNKPDKLYYLVDKNTTDYSRLVAEGYYPLKRGSFLHRLVFLNANMVIASNSTVFAFNDYYLENCRYIRGIPDFDVVCVQHGLSVQKIALAQQRLRDNTRLYFCASKYEIENLEKPVYDYKGYNALKLTGVPRYDGLVDRSKKQIMISPTWRMQSAMLVSKNEGVERDYNPLFKETPYYKVYNGLINDTRLIKAAEEYGYRLAYVLHPIVSPQADDFEKNSFVDIIPSVGDMSYEKLLTESSLMVTDYSGVQFDMAYMRKPLVYYHPEELEAHYEEGTFHYDTMAFGEIVKKKDELVDLLIGYMKDGCRMKERYRNRADDFFAYDDHNNCARIYNEMIRYKRY